MPSNRLILRKMASPWRTQHSDITRGTTLTHADLDNNFIFLKGEIIDSARLDGETLKLTKICGADIELSLSALTQNNEDSLRNVEDIADGLRDDLDTNVTIINNTINEIKDGIEANTIWEWGSDGVKSIKVKNGSNNDATGDYSVSEGYDTKASGDYSHAEGLGTNANGYASHAGGLGSQANGDASFAHTKGTSKADGESSVVLGGTQHVVEGGGENSGVLLGDTNRILGLDYQKLINDTENEIKVITSEREKEHADFISLENDLKEQLDIKREQIEVLKNEIEELNSEISDLEFKKSELEAIDPRTNEIVIQINEITLVINDLQTLVTQKEEELTSLESEANQLKVEIEEATKKEDEAQEVYEENRDRLEKLLDGYNKALYEFDGYLPKQSTILGGSSNIINSASESVIDGGSGNTITSKVKNSGIFGGSKNELGSGTYIDLIKRLEEEANKRAEEKAKYDADTEKLIKSLQSDIEDKEKQLQSEKQQQPQDLGLIATLEADIKELKEEKNLLEEEVSRNNAEYEAYVKQTDEKIEAYKTIEYAKYGEVPSNVITPIDGASIIAGSGNKIIHLSDNSSIIGGKSNLIDNASGSVILGGEGITATTNNTVYTPNLNIDIQPANDNSLTQVLVRDGDGNVKYKDVASFTDLSVVSGVYDIRTGIVTLINNDGNSFEISGFTSGMTDSYTTEAYLEDKTIYFNNNIKGDDIYSVDISPILNDVIASIGLNDNRGTCSVGKYAEYTTKVQEYYDSKEAYDEYDSNIKTLTDEITQLNADIDTLKSDLEFKGIDLIYTQITGGSVEELQIIINQKEADLNSKQAELKQKEAERERDIKRQEEIKNSGALEFAPYVPANEANFNCWSERQIIDSVGYDNRGNCSGDRYEKYISEYNDALDYYNTEALPRHIPSYSDTFGFGFREGITYNKLSTERQRLVDYWQQISTDTNNLISSYDLEITKYQTIIDSEEDQSKIDELNEIIILLEDRKRQVQEPISEWEESYNMLILFLDTIQTELENTDAYNFIQQYTPINEVNFNCWNDSKDYNDLHSQITGITYAVGYNDRGTCSRTQYASYRSEVQNYYYSKELYKIYDSNIKTLTDEINQLNDDLLNASTQQESDAISANIEQKQVQKQSYVNARQQIIDSGDLEFAPYAPANESNFNCWRNDLLDDKIDTKTDLSLFNSYTSSTETVISAITSTIGYNDRGTCSVGKYAEYTTKVQEYYDIKTEYDEYDSNIPTLTDEITELTSDIDTLESEINTLDRTIILGRLDGIDQTDNKNLKVQKNSELSQKNTWLSQKQAQRQSYIANKQQIIDSGYLEFASYVPANEVNFNCWSEQQIIDSVGYDDRGTCDWHTYHQYENLVHNLEASQIDYNELIRELNEATEVRTIENQNFKKEHALITDNIAFYEDVLTQINQTIQNEGRDATPEELMKIAALEELINKFIKDREEDEKEERNHKEAYEALKGAYDEQIDDFENNIKPDIDRYLPANEVNYNCWRNEYFYEVAKSGRDVIISNVGYNDRGSCSEEQYASYESEVNHYYSSKEVYDEYDSNIKTLTDEITALEDSKTTKESSLTTKQNELLSIKPGSDFINANYDYIIAVSEELTQGLQTIKSRIQGWAYGTSEAEFLAEKTAVEAVITSSLATWNTLNDLMVVNTTFNYQNKGSITSALTNIKNSLDSTQTILDTMSHTDTEQVFLVRKNNVINSVNDSISSSQELQQDVTLSKDYYEQTNNDLKNDIEQLKAEIDTISVNIEQKQVQRQSYIDSKQQIIDSGVLEFVSYVPANEANFNCYINSLQNDKVDNIITNTDYQIYNIESALNRLSDRPGTFNYYPNIHDDFTENPRFIIGEFDDLDNIINLDESSKITWASLLAYYMNAANNSTNPENYRKLSNNLDKSFDCLKELLDVLSSKVREANNEFNMVISDIDSDLNILNMMSEAPIDEGDSKPFYVENIDRSVLQQRRQTLSNIMAEEQSKFDYMEQKIKSALDVYREIDDRAYRILAEIESKL